MVRHHLLNAQLGKNLGRLVYNKLFGGRIAAAIARQGGAPFRILNTSRPPIAVQARTQFDRYGKPQVQGVRLSPGYRPTAMLFTLAGGWATYGVYKWFVLRPLNDLVADLDDEEDENGQALNGSSANDNADKESAEEEAVRFIPFPLTTQLVQPGPYVRSDPEYIQYLKMKDDMALIKQILADAPAWAADQIPQHSYAFQNLKPKPFRKWLIWHFPELPPPFYTQTGLEIGNDFIAWSTFEIEADVAQRQERVLYPVPAAKAMWNFLKVAFTLGDANEMAGRILTEHLTLPTGFKVTFDQLVSATPAGQEARKQQAEQLRKKANAFALRISEQQNKAIESNMSASAGSSSSQQPSETSFSSSSGQSANNNQSRGQQTQSALSMLKEFARKKQAGEWSTKDDEAFNQYLLTRPGMHSLIQISKRFKYASVVSQAIFMRETKPIVLPPPRGAVKISGLMQMAVPNGWMTFHVELHWDPKTKDFDEHSFKAKLMESQIDRRRKKIRSTTGTPPQNL